MSTADGQLLPGGVHYDHDVARTIGQDYERLVAVLRAQQTRLQALAGADGFGGFESAHQLRDGFRHKAAEAATALDVYIAGADRLAEAFLQAAQRYADADAGQAESTAAVEHRIDTP